MKTPTKQLELPLLHPSPGDTVIINARCTLCCKGAVRFVSIAGLPMYHWITGDQMAEAYAMINLEQCGYADQNEIARAFGYSRKTLWRHHGRYETAGLLSLGKSSGRPKETLAAPSPWVRTAALLHANGMDIRAIAQRLKVGKTAVGKWLNRSDKSADPPKVTAPAPTAPPPDAKEKVLVQSPTNKEMPGSSLDNDPANRVVDRCLARRGQLDDAPPLFNPGRRIPRAGVLLAVPALVHSGIFSVADEVYRSLGPAFYGLRTTMLAFLLMGLLRIKRPEGLKEHGPTELGRLLGLDRAPEVKTLRRKLSQMAELGKAEVFGRKLAQRRVARRGKAIGFLYVDGHVRVYHGRRRLPKAHVTRMRLSLPATTDYWVNDQAGDPLFVVTAEVNAGLVQMLPLLLKEVRALIGPRRRVTVIFDRGGWSPKLFVKLIAAGFDILTYRKGRWRKIPRTQFMRHARKIEGRVVAYDLNDRRIRLLKGRLRLRQITRLSEDGHQTPIVTSRLDLSAVVLAYRMFERWRQENFFKYLREEFALDELVDYGAEAEAAERMVPNPQRRKLEKILSRARAELQKAQALYGAAAVANTERTRPTIRGFKIAHGKLGRRIKTVQNQIAVLERRRDQMPARVAVCELAGKPLMRLSHERKHLTDCLKMVAYQAESDLLALIRPHYARADDEGRTLVTSALQSAADLEVVADELRVTLAPLSSEHRSNAIAAMCAALNQMKICFPGTKLRMRFGAPAKDQ